MHLKRCIIITETRTQGKAQKQEVNTMTNKEEAKRAYKEAKAAWQNNMDEANWRRFCEAKRVCRLLGIRI